MNEHGFSVQLKSKEHVTNIAMSDKGGEAVLFEGILGELEGLEIIEEAVLRITGTNGTLMVDLPSEELQKRLSEKKKIKVDARARMQGETYDVPQ